MWSLPLKLFEIHQVINLEKNAEEIFSGYCKEEEHNNYKLEFFCKNHNQLCCGAFLCKIKKKEYGKHKDCEVCDIEDIKDKKIQKLKENI